MDRDGGTKMNSLEYQMAKFIGSINQAIEDKNWYATLSLAVTLPDICSRLDGTKTGKKSMASYVNWFDNYVGKEYKVRIHGKKDDIVFLNGKHAYALRCAFLHDGAGDLLNHWAMDKNLNTDEIAFAIPKDKKEDKDVQVNFSAGVEGRTLILNIVTYCEFINQGVESWLKKFHSNKDVIGKAEKMIVIKPLEEYQTK